MSYKLIKYNVSKDAEKKIYKKALEITKERNLKIHYGKELLYYIMDDEDIVGVLFISDNVDDFSWDVAVSKDYDGEGIGKILITKAIEEYEELKTIYGDDYLMKIEVVNPKMKDIMINKFGFKISETLSDKNNWIMTESINKKKILLERMELLNIASYIEKEGAIFKKFAKVLAVPAKKGQKVITMTSDGKETENVAKDGDYLITNIETEAKEQYLINDKTFKTRYIPTSDINVYEPTGECIAVKISKAFLEKFNLKQTFKFLAPWGENMVAKKGDFLCINPETKEVYRIAKKEFYQTYKLANPEFIVGVEVEREHGNSYELRKKIATDHINDNPKYYTKLYKAGIIDEPVAEKKAEKYLIEKLEKLTEKKVVLIK